MTLIILSLAVVLLLCLLYAEKGARLAGRIVFKQALSTLFVATACLQPWLLRSYMIWMVIGLVLCWFGDLFLIFKPRSMFLSGLVAFLLGHVCYALGFYSHGALNSWVFIGLALILAVGGAIFAWLRPHLGDMKVPVIAYILIISAMVGGAFSFFSAPAIGDRAQRLVLIGALLFFASDFFVARDQFVKPGFDNRLIGLPLYYAAQFMFAFSVGAV